MSSRLSDPRKGSRVIIMQRLHEDDLSGHVLRGDLHYEHLRLPSEFEPKDKCITYTTNPTTKERKKFYEDPRKVADELLFPALFDAPAIADAKKELRDAYAGQHQQRPAPAEGLMFKKAWWNFWKPDGTTNDGITARPEGCTDRPARPLPPRFDRMILSLDAAFKDKPKNDFVVFEIIGCRKADRFVMDRSRARRDFVSTCAEFQRLVRKWPQARAKLIEDKANGTAVINKFHREISGIIEIEPAGGKEARASALQPEVQSGNWYLPEGAPWLDEWIEEFSSFPNAKHDDQVDAASQAAVWLGGSNALVDAKAMVNM